MRDRIGRELPILAAQPAAIHLNPVTDDSHRTDGKHRQRKIRGRAECWPSAALRSLTQTCLRAKPCDPRPRRSETSSSAGARTSYKRTDSLDRAALRQIVFADQAELDALNRIVHPGVTRLRDREIADAQRSAATRSSSASSRCSSSGIWSRSSTPSCSSTRRARSGSSASSPRAVLEETDAMNMIASQMPAELKRARADYVIENTGTLQDLERDVNALWSSLQRNAVESEIAPVSGMTSNLFRSDESKPGLLDSVFDRG